MLQNKIYKFLKPVVKYEDEWKYENEFGMAMEIYASDSK